MKSIEGKLIKIVRGVEKAVNCWLSGKSTWLGIRHRVRGLVLLGLYCNKPGGGRGGRGCRGWLWKKIKEKHMEENPNSRESENQCGEVTKGVASSQIQRVLALSLYWFGHRFGGRLSKCRFWFICFLVVWSWVSDFTSLASPGSWGGQSPPGRITDMPKRRFFFGRVVAYYVQKVGLDLSSNAENIADASSLRRVRCIPLGSTQPLGQPKNNPLWEFPKQVWRIVFA